MASALKTATTVRWKNTKLKNALRPQVQAKQRLSYPALESHEDLRYQEMLILLQGLAPKVGTPWVLKALVFFDLSTHAASNKSMAWLDEAGRKPSISLRL